MKKSSNQNKNKATLVRGEPVVRRVLTSALRELARVGYEAFRIEDVAELAGVNKTTIYRRWPTKEDLVRAAFLSMAGDKFAAPNTGTLRGDLVEIGLCMKTFAESLEGQSLIRVMIAEGPDSELMSIARSIRALHEARPRSIFEHAVKRGELGSTTGTMLVLDVLKATLHYRLFFERENIDAKYLRSLTDLLLHGAFAGGKLAAPKTTKAARKRS